MKDSTFPLSASPKPAGQWTSSKPAPRTALNITAVFDQATFDKLASLLRYVDGDYADAATFAELRKQLGKAQRPLHYLAVPPSLFGVVAEGLAKSGCATNARIVVEKPFGHDLTYGRGAQSDPASILSRGEHLSHRSLPRQGAGAEHPVYAVRQPDLRADLEP